MPYKDRKAQREAQQRSYARNKERILERSRERSDEINGQKRERRQDKADRLRSLKESQPCADCGIQYPARVMEFDHVRGEKIGNICRMLNAHCGWEMIEAEIAKCELVCANCHRLRH